MINLLKSVATTDAGETVQAVPSHRDGLDLNDLDQVAGGLAKYYEMGGHWYIVGHDKHGKATGVVRID